MKVKKIQTRLIAALTFIMLIAIGFQSCNGLISDDSFYIDNPTSAPVTVTLDDKTYELPADYSEKVHLETGAHTMILPDGQTVKFNVFYHNKGGIINPTRSLYVVYRMIYEVESKSNLRTFDQKVIIDGIEYEGPMNTINDLFIDKNKENYDYGLHEPFPEELTLSGSQKGAFRTKIFTKQQFVEFWEDGSEFAGYHEANKEPGWVNKPTKTDVPQIPTPHFSVPELQTNAQKMSGLIQQYLASTGEGEQKRLAKEYQELYKQVYEASTVLNDFQKYSTNERQAYQSFSHACSNAISTGIAEVK